MSLINRRVPITPFLDAQRFKTFMPGYPYVHEYAYMDSAIHPRFGQGDYGPIQSYTSDYYTPTNPTYVYPLDAATGVFKCCSKPERDVIPGGYQLPKNELPPRNLYNSGGTMLVRNLNGSKPPTAPGTTYNYVTKK
jgi:hypothetical protein